MPRQAESRAPLAAEAEAAAKSEPASAETAALQSQSEELNGKVQTLFRGETLRGLLLTSYGFSIFGERAQQSALVAFGAAFVLFLASIAGFIHTFTDQRRSGPSAPPRDRAVRGCPAARCVGREGMPIGARLRAHDRAICASGCDSAALCQ